MRFTTAVSCLLSAALGAAPPASAQESAPVALPGLDKTWLEASIDDFTVWSNSSRRRTTKVVEELEAFRGVLRLFFPALQHAPRRETFVYYFDAARQFQVYGTADKRVAGFFLAQPEANYIAVDGSTGSPYATVFHEYVHYMLRNNVPDLPLWLNEGLAEYFQTFHLDRGKAEFGGERFWIQHLATHDWMDYREVLAARVGSDLYRDPARSLDFRAQAWGLTHLLYDPDSREELVGFMGSLGRGVASDEALLGSFDATFESLETLVRNHVRRAVLSSWVVDADDLGDVSEVRIRQLVEVEVLSNLARLLATAPTDERAAAARQLAERALRQAPDHVPALVAQATLLLRRQEGAEEARRILDRALAVEPDHPAALYRRGQASLRLFEAESTAGASRSGELLLAARRDFARAHALDPHFRSAANDLAHTYLYEPAALQTGVDIAARELAKGPHLILAMTLMELHATGGDREAAWKVHEEKISRWLDATAESGVAVISRAVERTDLMVARAWVRQGRCAEAADLLRVAATRSSHEDVGEEIRAELEGMESCAGQTGAG